MKSSSRIAVLVLFSMVSLPSNAQLLTAYGIKLGAVAANQTWDYTSFPDFKTDNRWGFTAEGFVELFDLPFLTAVVELQYTQKGMSESIPVTTESQPDGTGELLTLHPRVDYLSIPVLAKLRLSGPVITPYVIVGPRFDFLLSKRGEGYDLVIDKFKGSDFGATLGIGVEADLLSPISLLTEVRYNPSFTNAYQNQSLTVTNRSFDFLVGVRLALERTISKQ